jgi:hypothetical protein
MGQNTRSAYWDSSSFSNVDFVLLADGFGGILELIPFGFVVTQGL